MIVHVENVLSLIKMWYKYFIANYIVIVIIIIIIITTGQACIRQSSAPTGVCTDGSVRLICLSSVNSNSRIDDNAGRLEVCRGNVWGTVHLISASSFWSEKNNQVACRQLGFEGALNSIPPIQ